MDYANYRFTQCLIRNIVWSREEGRQLTWGDRGSTVWNGREELWQGSPGTRPAWDTIPFRLGGQMPCGGAGPTGLLTQATRPSTATHRPLSLVRQPRKATEYSLLGWEKQGGGLIILTIYGAANMEKAANKLKYNKINVIMGKKIKWLKGGKEWSKVGMRRWWVHGKGRWKYRDESCEW